MTRKRQRQLSRERRKTAAAGRPTVGVVVPMHNAAATVDATLASLCGQTWRELDIVVVDDGSTDAGAAIVRDWAGRDSRISLLRQPNAGVACARNAGAASTDARYLAFLDADDVWAPTKVELQMAALGREGSEPELVYSWFVPIDAFGRVFPVSGDPPAIEGDVLRQMCRSNFVGNGSSILVPRALFEAIGGFDPSLRARSAQGCEDLMFLLRAAEICRFRLVPRYLVGYRVTPRSMSSDTEQMLRSFELVLGSYSERYPAYRAEFESHLQDMLLWLAERAVVSGRAGHATELLARLTRLDSGRATAALPNLLRIYFRARLLPGWAKETMRALNGRARRSAYLKQTW